MKQRILVTRPTFSDVVDRLRGKPQTVVEVGLLRPATRERMDLKLTREIIKMDSVAEARVTAFWMASSIDLGDVPTSSITL